MMHRLGEFMRRLWNGLRTLSGDDAYERYLAHWQEHHAHEEEAPLDRKEFYKANQEREWNKPRRCC